MTALKQANCDDEYREGFAIRFRSILEDNNITQAQLSDKTGINQNLINHFCRGRRLPSMRNLSKILESMWFISAHWLITGEKNE